MNLDYRLLHEKRLAKEIVGEVVFGRVELTYSHNALASLSDVLIRLKDLPSFRDLNLGPGCFFPQNEKDVMTPEMASEANARQKENARVQEALTDLHINPIGETRNKARQVNNEIRKCMIDVKIRGERLYVSFFDHLNRD